MARKRRTSAVLETSRQRLAGLKQFKKPPNFGPELTTPAYETVVNGFTDDLDLYNQHLAGLDDEQNHIDSGEETLADWNKRILAAVGAQFGTDSSEYELVGGTRTSERKSRTPKEPGDAPASGNTPPAKP